MKDRFAVSMFGQKRLSREGGIEIVVKELCTRMARDGCQVTCYNRSGHHVSGAEYDNKIEYDGIRQKFVPTIERKGLAAVSSSFFAALYSAFGKYDVVHIQAEGPAFFSWLPKMFRKRVVVNTLICKVYRTIKSVDSSVEFGISPQGNIGNNDGLYADVKSWCTCKGFADYICPQIYFSLENPALTFEDCLNSWTSLDFDENVKLYVGLGGYKAGNGEYDEETWLLSDSILADEYDILRNNKSVRGFMLYSYSCLEDDTAKKEINNLINALN